MIYMFCADGLEEVEALAALDVIRRAGLDIRTVGVDGKEVHGAHGITFISDMTISEFESHNAECECVILPGGGVGTQTLAGNETVKAFVKKIYAEGGIAAAICAAPSVLGRLGLLEGRSAVCYPGFEKYLYGANVKTDKVVRDGNIITAKGMGCAVEFGLMIVSALCGEQTAEKIGKSIMLY